MEARGDICGGDGGLGAFGKEFTGLSVLGGCGDVRGGADKKGDTTEAEEDVGSDPHGWCGRSIVVVVGIVDAPFEFFAAWGVVYRASEREIVEAFCADIFGGGWGWA